MVGEKGLLYNKSKEIFNEKIFKDAMPEGIWRKVAADDEDKVMFLKNSETDFSRKNSPVFGV